MGCLTANDGHVSYLRLAAGADRPRRCPLRVCSTGHRSTRGRARLKEGRETQPWVAVVRAGMAGGNDGDQNGGGRSTVGCGFGVAVHERRRCWWLRSRGVILRTVVYSGGSSSGYSHDGHMARRRRASAPVRTRATRCNRGGEERGSKW